MVRPHVHTFSALFEVAFSRFRPHVTVLKSSSVESTRRPHALLCSRSHGFPNPQGVPAKEVALCSHWGRRGAESVVVIQSGQHRRGV